MRKVLVVMDDASIEKSHSQLLSSLASAHLELDLQVASSEKEIVIKKDGDYLYDGVALLCPTALGMDSKLPISSLIKFLESGRDILFVAGFQFSDYSRAVAKMIGVDLTESDELVMDHVNSAGDGWVYAGGHVSSWRLFGKSESDAKIAYKGPAATLFADNELIDSVVWGGGSSYAAKDKAAPLRKPMRAQGSASVLGAVLSTRARSRAAYWGSLEALSNDAAEKYGQDHSKALQTFSAWPFGHGGVLEVTSTRHYLLGEKEDSGKDRGRGYRVKDVVAFEMDILEWRGNEARYRPFSADDIQLEFTMLNPWVRTHFVSLGNGTFHAEVKIPDQIGIYKFVLAHYRAGISPIAFEEVVPVRPFLHNEYDRFLLQAVPYYTSAFSMIAGVLLLGFVFLNFSEDSNDQVPEGKKNRKLQKTS